VVSGEPVEVDGRTDYRKGRCSDLRSGADVRVRGTRRGNGPIQATRIDFDKDRNDDDDDD
jgi:hypothetical protein